MGRQFGIYTTKADMIEIERLVQSIGEPFLIFERTRSNSSPAMLPDLAASGSLGFRISRKADFNDVLWSPLKDGREFVDDVSSPVIEVSPSFFNGKAMSRGRFYYIPSYYDDRDEKVNKPEPFLKWAQAVFRKVKGGLPLNKAFPLPTYVGPAAQIWLDEHEPYDVDNSGRITTAATKERLRP